MRDGRDEMGLGTAGRDGDRREGNGMGVMGWGQEGGMGAEGRETGWDRDRREGWGTGGSQLQDRWNEMG